MKKILIKIADVFFFCYEVFAQQKQKRKRSDMYYA